MTGTKNRAAAALAMGMALTGLVGCATVPGTSVVEQTDVAAYESTIAASRAAEAAAAAKSACTSWRAGNETRVVATIATANFTKNPNWQWDGIATTVNAELAALATEAGKLPAIITTAQPNPSVHTLIVNYKAKLDAYAVALRADFEARGTGDQTWPRRNPANRELNTAEGVLRSACPKT